MDRIEALERRLRRVEDREAIRELVGRYGVHIDDRDLPRVAALFAPDAQLTSQDGVMRATGREAIVELYRGRYAALGATMHYTHDQLVEFDEHDPDRATGLVLSHAEVFRNGQAMLAAMRYQDEYRRHAGRWVFARRNLTFFYYLPVTEYAEALGGLDRMRAYGDRRPADFPERLPGFTSWQQR